MIIYGESLHRIQLGRLSGPSACVCSTGTEENNRCFTGPGIKQEQEKHRERERIWTADERSPSYSPVLRRWHSVLKASAERSTNRDEDFRGTGSTRLLLVEHTVFAIMSTIYIWAAMPHQAVSGIMPIVSNGGLACERHGTVHPICVAPTEVWPHITTTQSVTVAVISVTQPHG
jgi:hypothetical protein